MSENINKYVIFIVPNCCAGSGGGLIKIVWIQPDPQH